MTTEHPDDARGDELPAELHDALAALDPVAGDPPPPAGSTRHLAILELAMATAPTTAEAPPASTTPDRAEHRPRRHLALALAAAAVVAVVVGLVVVAPGTDPEPASASVALADAAHGTGDATTLRITAVYERPGSTNRLEAEADGANYRIRSEATYADGHEESATTVVIGDTVWEDGEERTGVPPEERNAAFASSSAAVVEAILDGSTLEELGEEDVQGTTARHLRATLTPQSRAALAALSPSRVAMFELEYPEHVDAIDLWIADDLIRRIQVELDQGVGEDGVEQQERATIEFYDFGADIEITPPS
ncbi:MAG: hypothetical protein KDB04_01915 [Acidimicrobiales bacterium]|nr:hypothetical protein [Acidimicrobiales bacterium]HRW39698.1 hypothetical protein [Aquihabitans sp.]